MTKKSSPRATRTTTVRLLEVVEALCLSSSSDIGQLSEQLGIPQSTVYRHIDSLVESRFLAKAPDNKLMMGSRLRTMLFESLVQEPSITARRAILRELSDQIQETVSVSVPYGLDIFYFDRVEYNWPLNYKLQVGDKLAIIGSASGRLFLSGLEQETALGIFRSQFQDEVTSAAEKIFLDDLKTIAEQGYALDNEQFLEGMVGASVPIRNENDEVCAFLSTHGLSMRKTIDEIRDQIPLMKETAAKLEALFFPVHEPIPEIQDEYG